MELSIDCILGCDFERKITTLLDCCFIGNQWDTRLKGPLKMVGGGIMRTVISYPSRANRFLLSLKKIGCSFGDHQWDWSSYRLGSTRAREYDTRGRILNWALLFIAEERNETPEWSVKDPTGIQELFVCSNNQCWWTHSKYGSWTAGAKRFQTWRLRRCRNWRLVHRPLNGGDRRSPSWLANRRPWWCFFSRQSCAICSSRGATLTHTCH